MLKIWLSRTNIRCYSIKHVTKKPVKYTNTINLPKTNFPNRLSAPKRQEVERTLVEGPFSKAYCYQEAHNKEPAFVVHDGPPYANGDLHMGHAVNKILKDITLRQHVASGQKVHYIPGWDCHGLPIELKAMSSSASEETKKDVLSIRKKSRQYALDAIQRQKEEFRNWGIFSDWNNAKNIYLTFSSDFIINQLEMFSDLYEKGLVMRTLMPVYWSPSSRTALAEAELEYDANFVSPSVYVRFALNDLPPTLSASNHTIYALVWTTTPWTLPSNQAICYNAALDYSLVQFQGNGNSLSTESYLIASDLLNDFQTCTQIKCEEISKIKGTDLASCNYQHPFSQHLDSLPFFDAPHVQSTKGTGLVHTAPAHGPDDFLVSLEHKLPVISYVNDEGVYTSNAPEFLRGKAVLEEGDRLVLQHVAEDVVFASNLTHTYPIDWRTKKPVIIRASEQWFINTDQLKSRAVQEINNIQIYPRVNMDGSKNALLTQVQKRPYWCISRQRAWGVPIPVFYDRHTEKVITNKRLVSHICKMIEEEGSVDFWWSKPISEILPENLLNELNLNADDLIKGSDIFDIWFDSGSTWSTVLEGDKIADVYLEGYDQFTGWFQSSLLTSIAARNCAPYKSLFVHGFTVDEKGKKMSKSLGNVISPKEVTTKYGVDVLRWWVAAHGTQHMSITVSENLLQQAAESLSKVRATMRYLNGVIGEKLEQAAGTNDKQTYLNKYLLSALVEYDAEIQRCYDSYEYNRVVAVIQNFVANKISAVYVNLAKDRLYCGDKEDLQNIRFTLTQCYELLCKSLWPVVPFLVEESWSYYDLNGGGFHQQSVKPSTEWKDEDVESVVNTALGVKRLINQKASDVNSLTLAVNIVCPSSEKLQLLQQLQPELNAPSSSSELCEVLQVGSVTLDKTISNSVGDDFTIVVKQLDVLFCPRCRRFAVPEVNCICERCANVLNV